MNKRKNYRNYKIKILNQLKIQKKHKKINQNII